MIIVMMMMALLYGTLQKEVPIYSIFKTYNGLIEGLEQCAFITEKEYVIL